jgi:putative membrane-bound dehydrogenase-like protein
LAARLLIAACLLALPCNLAAVLGAGGDDRAAATPVFTPPKIEVPPGYAVELAAAPPLVKYPMMACLDERGRMFIAESDGRNLGKEDLLNEQPRFVRLIEDTDADGKFDKSTIFADKMVMPEGALWHEGALYILSAPYLWRLEDIDGDGVADRREKLVGAMDLIGNANQHGPYLAPDGRLLFSGGTFGYDLVGTDGTRATGNWAGVFSCRPDGTDVRIECHAGINPVEVAFTPAGEMLGTCAIFDRIGGRHDALAHWVHGATYGEYVRPPTLRQTGRYLPAAGRWGQVAPSGLVRYRGAHLGEECRDNLFVCQFNTHALVRVRLEREGATFRAADEAFLSSPSIDFHPADVLEDADGSLLLIDTGSWLTMGCPTSKSDDTGVFGAIYRVRKIDGPVEPDPRGWKLDWSGSTPADTLVARLDDPRPAVRDRATASLAQRGDEAIAALTGALEASTSARLRLGVVWTLARIGTPAAQTLLGAMLADAEPTVRQAAAHSLGNLGSAASLAPLMKIVVDDELPVRREAATALGLIGQAAAVPALLQSLGTARDEFLEHALIYALIEIHDPAATRPGLADSVPRVQRAALIALDQMSGGGLARESVAPLLATSDSELQRAALDVIGKRPGWADEIVGLLGESLRVARPTPAQQALMAGAVTAFARNESVQSLVAAALDRPATTPATQRVLLEAIARSELAELPAPWLAPLGKLLASADPKVQRQAIATLATCDAPSLDETLRRLARDTSRTIDLRVAALGIVARRAAPLEDDAFQLVISRIDQDVAGVERLSAAITLGKAALTAEQLAAMPAVVERAGPLELPAILPALAGAAQAKRVEGEAARELGLRLLEALEKSPGVATLSAAQVQAVFDHYPWELSAALKQRLRQDIPDSQQQRARVAEVESQAARGVAEHGRNIFFSHRAACSACHRIAGDGGSIGPDLTQIGKVRSTRDLVEAILIPSATLANGFESYTLATRSGQSLTGLIRHETAEAIHLVTTDGNEVRLPRAEIEAIGASAVSLMPQGIDQTLTAEQLRDLVAFLSSLK